MLIVLFHVMHQLRYIPSCSVNDRSTIEVVPLTSVTSRCESSGIQRTLSNEFEQTLIARLSAANLRFPASVLLF